MKTVFQIKSVQFKIGKRENHNGMTSADVTVAPARVVNVERVLGGTRLGTAPLAITSHEWAAGRTAGRMTDSSGEGISVLTTILFPGRSVQQTLSC